jgi:fructuronate reductase
VPPPDTDARRPPRIVHLGLGVFHRAHEAWYTQADPEWGIAAFTGRTPDAARRLAAQDCRYTVIERAAAGDTAELVDAIVEAHDGADAAAWRALVSNEFTAIVSLTVTEAGYTVDPGDIELLSRDDGSAARTPAGRIVDGLRARARSGAGPISVVSCDNLPRNGEVTRRAALGVALAVDPSLADWIDTNVSFVSTMVDRITPATEPDDLAVASALTGIDDAAPVVTEQFTEWVLAGEFWAGRPRWERRGARFVDDISPFETRKLWLLNAGHSLLAYHGLLLGHQTIADAVGEDAIVAELEALWDEAAVVIDLPGDELTASRAALRDRFDNPRIRHRLAQIAIDGSLKLPHRIIAPIRARLATGLPVGDAQAGVLAAWARHLVSPDLDDPAASALVDTLRSSPATAWATAVITHLAPDLAADERLVTAVTTALGRIPTPATRSAP